MALQVCFAALGVWGESLGSSGIRACGLGLKGLVKFRGMGLMCIGFEFKGLCYRHERSAASAHRHMFRRRSQWKSRLDITLLVVSREYGYIIHDAAIRPLYSIFPDSLLL